MAERDEVLDGLVFSVGARSFSWREVIAAARIWSNWSEVEGRARLAVGAQVADERAIAPGELEDAQDRFRYERNLLAADDLEAWLDRWGISIERWVDQVRASVLLEAGAEPDSGDELVDPAELEAAAWAEAVCSGELERLAERLAVRYALAEAAGGGGHGAVTADELERIEAAYVRFCEQAGSEEGLARRVRDEQLEWTRIEGRYLAHPDEDVVREAALGVTEEGVDLEDMARAAGARYEPAARFYLSDIEGELHARLLAVTPGEICGPLRSGDELWLLEVSARVAPSLADPEIRARATAVAVSSAVKREMVRHVRWHDRPAS